MNMYVVWLAPELKLLLFNVKSTQLFQFLFKEKCLTLFQSAPSNYNRANSVTSGKSDFD